MTELKSCPFCGGQADTMTPEADDMRAATVMCMGCYCTGKECETEAQAIAAWNRRAPQAAPAASEPVTLTYTNWQGKTAQRTITPVRVWFGLTPWHPEPQWLLTAVDAEKGLERDFALKDFGAPAPSDGLREAVERAAVMAECAFDDRPRDRSGHPSHMDWEDGYREGTRAAAEAIRAALTPAPAQEGLNPNWTPQSCTAWEDCKIDGICHDPEYCASVGPNARNYEDQADD